MSSRSVLRFGGVSLKEGHRGKGSEKRYAGAGRMLQTKEDVRVVDQNVKPSIDQLLDFSPTVRYASLGGDVELHRAEPFLAEHVQQLCFANGGDNVETWTPYHRLAPGF